MSSCDCESPSCYARTTPRARKAHTCEECDQPIRVGEVHERITGVWDGRPDSFRRHLSCAALFRAYEEHVRCEQQREIAEQRAADLRYSRGESAAREHAAFLRTRRAYLTLCDCISIGSLAEALREFSIEIHGYDPRETARTEAA